MSLSLSGRVTADSITGCVHFSPVFTDAEGRDDNEGMRFELIQQGGVWSITSIR